MSTTLNPDPYYDVVTASKYLGTSKSFLAKLRIRGDGPRFVKFGAMVRYRRSDLDDWAARRTVTSTTPPVALRSAIRPSEHARSVPPAPTPPRSPTPTARPVTTAQRRFDPSVSVERVQLSRRS